MAKKMTIVEKYEAIIGKVEGVLTADEIAFLKERADMHSKKNANRKPTKAQEENEGIKSQIVECLKENGAMVASVIAEKVGISTQKARALCKLLVEEKTITVADIKVKNKGTLKQYALAETEEVAEEVAE